MTFDEAIENADKLDLVISIINGLKEACEELELENELFKVVRNRVKEY